MSLKEKTIKYIKENCQCSLIGKNVLITGANSGIGYKTAEIMLQMGASIIMACRNRKKAEIAREVLLKDYPHASINIMQLDLSDFHSIDIFAATVPEVDIFINNAGTFHQPNKVTEDGFDLVMCTNYIGVFYLSEILLERFYNTCHNVIYINTISIAHKIGRINYKRFNESLGAYSRSKLCLAKYSMALAQKYKGTNIHVYMCHPGIVMTNIIANAFKHLFKIARLLPFNSAEKSALAPLWIAANKPPEGSVVGPNHLFCGWGYPEINKACPRASKGSDKLIEFTNKEIQLYTK